LRRRFTVAEKKYELTFGDNRNLCREVTCNVSNSKFIPVFSNADVLNDGRASLLARVTTIRFDVKISKTN
ncbi:MAG: hypothetical protein AAFY76_09285, partial [Cyanobacteria bacterium J06649_11]